MKNIYTHNLYTHKYIFMVYVIYRKYNFNTYIKIHLYVTIEYN